MEGKEEKQQTKISEKKLVLSEQETNEILFYLAEKPYKEVFKLISMIQTKWIIQNNK